MTAPIKPLTEPATTFARRHIAYLLADWTNRDAAITALR